eukprot:Nk52_evm9s2612 gene=Nk52_evmTU9s2612
MVTESPREPGRPNSHRYQQHHNPNSQKYIVTDSGKLIQRIGRPDKPSSPPPPKRLLKKRENQFDVTDPAHSPFHLHSYSALHDRNLSSFYRRPRVHQHLYMNGLVAPSGRPYSDQELRMHALREKKLQFVMEKPHLMHRLQMMSLGRPATSTATTIRVSGSARQGQPGHGQTEQRRRRVQSAPGTSQAIQSRQQQQHSMGQQAIMTKTTQRLSAGSSRGHRGAGRDHHMQKDAHHGDEDADEDYEAVEEAAVEEDSLTMAEFRKRMKAELKKFEAKLNAKQSRRGSAFPVMVGVYSEYDDE